MLLHLKNSGVKTALVTLSGNDVLEVLKNENHNIKSAADFNTVFDKIITIDMVEKRKPNPECYIKAMELLGLRADECLIFEDNLVGAMAAKAAGIDTCIVYDRHADGEREQLLKLMPFHIKTFREIL